MSPNKYKPHVLVLQEDDANRELATGFQLSLIDQRKMQVLPVAGGWNGILEQFKADLTKDMYRWKERFVVLLIDFDGRDDRLARAQEAIPADLTDRVFILGAWSNPEALRTALAQTWENIGKAMADDCREETDTMWRHALLQHNAGELERLRSRVRSILF